MEKKAFLLNGVVTLLEQLSASTKKLSKFRQPQTLAGVYAIGRVIQTKHFV